MKATERLIVSLWTLEYEVVENGKAKILNYSKTDQEGYDREEELPQFRLIETDECIVTHILLKPFSRGEWVTTEVYEVVNPQHVYSYGSE